MIALGAESASTRESLICGRNQCWRLPDSGISLHTEQLRKRYRQFPLGPESPKSFVVTFLLPLVSKLFSIIFSLLILFLFETFKILASLRSCSMSWPFMSELVVSLSLFLIYFSLHLFLLRDSALTEFYLLYISFSLHFLFFCFLFITAPEVSASAFV